MAAAVKVTLKMTCSRDDEFLAILRGENPQGDVVEFNGCGTTPIDAVQVGITTIKDQAKPRLGRPTKRHRMALRLMGKVLRPKSPLVPPAR